MNRWIYYQTRPSIRKEYMQEYYRKNRDRINARVADYCATHKEERKAWRKKWYAENKDLQRERVRRCRKKYWAKYGIWRSKLILTKYEDLIAKAKTQREKNALRKKMYKAKDKYMTMKKRWAEIRVKKAREKREAKVQEKIDAWKEEVLNSNQIAHENEENSRESWT